MALIANGFCEENDDKSEFDDTPIEPFILVPPTVSTLSINHLPTGQESLKKNRWLIRFSGAIYALTSSLLFTCATFGIKQLGIDLLDALILRSIVQTLITFFFVLYKRYPLISGTCTQILLQILCCATGSGGVFIFYCAIGLIELSDVVTLSYTRVIWTVVFSIFIYRERPSIGILIALPLTLLGVIFVTQPTFLFSSTISSIGITNNKYRILGLSLSIICAIASAINVLSFKQLVSKSKNIKSSIINFQYSFVLLIFLFIHQLYRKFILHTGLSFNYIISWQYLLASIICSIMIITYILTQKAMKREHPAIFTLLGSADIIFALILQNIFTKVRSNLYALLGSTLIILSVVIIGLSKILNERREKKKIKLMNNQTIIKDVEKKIQNF